VLSSVVSVCITANGKKKEEIRHRAVAVRTSYNFVFVLYSLHKVLYIMMGNSNFWQSVKSLIFDSFLFLKKIK